MRWSWVWVACWALASSCKSDEGKDAGARDADVALDGQANADADSRMDGSPVRDATGDAAADPPDGAGSDANDDARVDASLDRDATVAPDAAVVCGEPPGWRAEPGVGRVYALSAFSLMDPGFDVDHGCRSANDCAENSLLRLGSSFELALQQAITTGQLLLLVEVIQASEASCPSTVKLFAAHDADDPFYMANNFQIPQGEADCCRFRVEAQSRAHDRAGGRWPVAKAVGKLVGTSTSAWMSLPIVIDNFGGPDPHGVVKLQDLQLEVSEDASSARLGLGGVITARSAWETPAWTCTPFGSTVRPGACLASLVQLGPLDVDRDGDGLEELELGKGGSIERCYDGPRSCSGPCVTREARLIPPVDVARPESCVLDPRIADGYSFGVELEGPRATVVP